MLHTDINGPSMKLHRLIDGGVHDVQIIGVSSYAGQAPTFLVMTKEGALYADVPGHLLNTSNMTDGYKLHQVVYRNCPSSNCWVGKLGALQTAQVFDREHQYMGTGRYIATMDWPDDNWMMHIIQMETGSFEGYLIVWPHHHILWNTHSRTLPTGYRKVRETWRVNESG